MVFLRTLAGIMFLALVGAAYAQGTQVAFGAIRQDSSLPVEVVSENLDVDQDTGTAVFTGDVVVAQGEMRLSAPRVEVSYNDNRSAIEVMVASGGVTLVSGPDAAEGTQAVYTLDSGEIVMTGDVLLTQGFSAVASDRMTIQLDDGTARMEGNVKTILQTGNN